jgi:hypothetical protein
MASVTVDTVPLHLKKQRKITHLKICEVRTGNSHIIEYFSIWTVLGNGHCNASGEKSLWYECDSAVWTISQVH